MRKTESSWKTRCTILLSSRADLRSKPNGFSTTMRWKPGPVVMAVAFSCSTIVSYVGGGVAQ